MAQGLKLDLSVITSQIIKSASAQTSAHAALQFLSPLGKQHALTHLSYIMRLAHCLDRSATCCVSAKSGEVLIGKNQIKCAGHMGVLRPSTAASFLTKWNDSQFSYGKYLDLAEGRHSRRVNARECGRKAVFVVAAKSHI